MVPTRTNKLAIAIDRISFIPIVGVGDAVRSNLLRFGALGLIDGLHDIAGTGHLNRGFDRVFEIVRVVSRRFIFIAEVHLAQSEPEMARDRLGFPEHHGFVKIVFGQHAQGGGYRLFWRSVS